MTDEEKLWELFLNGFMPETVFRELLEKIKEK